MLNKVRMILHCQDILSRYPHSVSFLGMKVNKGRETGELMMKYPVHRPEDLSLDSQHPVTAKHAACSYGPSTGGWAETTDPSRFPGIQWSVCVVKMMGSRFRERMFQKVTRRAGEAGTSIDLWPPYMPHKGNKLAHIYTTHTTTLIIIYTFRK